MNNKYEILVENTNSLIKQSIEDKAKSTLNLALTISEFASKNKLFTQSNDKKFEVLKDISTKIKQSSNFKNLWIHIVDKDGFSRYRTWTTKKDDNVLSKRKELIKLIKEPKITSVISVGIFDLTFKSIIPVYENGKFEGFIETITKFNSIAQKFQNDKMDFLILVDKKYKEQIKKPFTKKFIKDYYIANINTSEKVVSFAEKNIDNILNITSYKIKDNKFITIYRLNDFNNEKMAYIFTFQDYEKVFSKEINNLQNFIEIIAYLIFLIIIGIFITYYYFNKSKYATQLKKEVNLRTKEIEDLSRRYKQVFEGSNSMKFLIDPDTRQIFDVNNATINFYGYTKEQLTSFKISDIQAENLNEDFIIEKILKNSEHKFIVKHKIASGEIKNMEVYASPIDIGEKKYIYTIVRDVTKELKLKKEYEEKQKLFYQQAKMASMGEMLENIAHQWRQPLSTITTAASGMKVKKDFDTLDDEFFDDSVEIIIKSSNYLSHTIDDFRNFFKHSNNFEDFKIVDAVNDCMTILKLKLHINEINISFEGDIETTINGYKNEFIQVFLNLINNSIDVFKTKNLKKGEILIEIHKLNKNTEIKYHDNAEGIDESIIDKIFEPYFTTKHKSQGTGIGLYMSEEIINRHFKGKFSVKNSSFKVNEKEYFGAEFKIVIPNKN
ncbi:ATP-binding protein [Campylobacterota bacterium DY0563]